MKDFKKMPKMASGGGVKKYSNGGDVVEEVRKAIRSGKDLDPGIMKEPKQREITFPGEKPVKYNAVEMPNLERGEGVNVPGYGRVKPAPSKTRGNLQLLKKGGKAKRGNKK